MNKKKIFKIALAAICIVATSAGAFKASLGYNSQMSDNLLSENVEALSSHLEGGNGYEVKSETLCPGYSYKKKRVCQVTIENTSCTASDCFH